MSVKDIFHNTVKVALEKDGWKITHDPLFFKLSEQIRIKIDMGAQKLISAEKDEQKIAVEVKSFIGVSAISEFHTAVGQFLNYRVALEQKDSERVLYLAIAKDIAVAKAVRTVGGKRAFNSVLCDFIAVLSYLSVAIS
ncbi:element excision factor XisH family protein, partial [Nostoc sp.]